MRPVDLRHEEEIPHESQEPLRVASHDTQVLTLCGRKILVVLEHQIEVAVDRRQRRS